MARPILCDFCQQKEAEWSYSVFADGSVLFGCSDDAGQFAIGLAISLGVIGDAADTAEAFSDSAPDASDVAQDVYVIEIGESQEPQPDPETDEPTDEPVDVAPEPARKGRRRTAA